MKIKRCHRNPYFLADFAYTGEFSDGEPFDLRIPESDVVEFANNLLKAFNDDMNGDVVVSPPYVCLSEKGAVFHDGEVRRKE